MGISFLTSTDEELLAAIFGQTRDLGTKRNLGLLIAKLAGWQRLMFLDDDIYGISTAEVAALAVGLSDHNVSVLIRDWFPAEGLYCRLDMGLGILGADTAFWAEYIKGRGIFLRRVADSLAHIAKWHAHCSQIPTA